MGLAFSMPRKTNTVKFINNYVKTRLKEKQGLNEQLKRLENQLKNEEIDKYTYERLKSVIQINLIQQREQSLERAFSVKF